MIDPRTTGALAQFAGVRVFVNSHAMRNEPRLVLEPKPWHAGRCYARRVQKKWNKRFGYMDVPAAYAVGDSALIVHPLIFAEMQRHSTRFAV